MPLEEVRLDCDFEGMWFSGHQLRHRWKMWLVLWTAFLAAQIQSDDGTISGNVHDHSSADDLTGDVEIHFALIVEGRYVGIVLCQSFMPRPHSKIVQDCIRRDRPLP